MNPSSPPPSSLLDLLRDPAQRDEGFRQLMKRYGRNLYWHIRRIVVGREDAEDVLQETCVKVLASLEYRVQPPLLRRYDLRTDCRRDGKESGHTQNKLSFRLRPRQAIR